MIDYIPLIVTFLLALLGLLLKTAKDPEGESLRRRLTGGGWAVLFLLSAALVVGLSTTVKRKRTDHELTRRAAERYERDSTTAAANLQTAHTQLLVQQGASEEARLAAATQILRLDSTLTASSILAQNLRDLGDSLRAQRRDLDNRLEEQQQLVRVETARLRFPLTAPRVQVNVMFPPIDKAREVALSRLYEDSTVSDSASARMRDVIEKSRYEDQVLFSYSQEFPYAFPSAFVITIWASQDGECDTTDPLYWMRSPSVHVYVPTSNAEWASFGRPLYNRPQYGLQSTQSSITLNNGVSSLLDLNDSCFHISHVFPDKIENDVSHLFQAIWDLTTVTSLHLNFGPGWTRLWSGQGLGLQLPVTARLP